MKITAPEKLDESVLESDNWIPGNLYCCLPDVRGGDYTNPFIYIESPKCSLARMEDGKHSFDPSEDRGDWVDVTNEFELMHSEYI